MSYFYSLHPAVSLSYFLSVIAIAMFCHNPILLLIALVGALLFFVCANRLSGAFREFGFYILLFLIVIITNPLFSHAGVTTLFFLNGNPITLEAIFYGAHIGIMLISVIYWFKCFNTVMTSDKLLYLFYKASPKMSLLLSSALRFIPLLKEQAVKIKNAQKTLGQFSSDSWMEKLRATLKVYSALVTFGLENAIDTGASMKARGYGLKNRSHYSPFKIKKDDILVFTATVILDAVIAVVLATEGLNFTFYPYISAYADSYGLVGILAFLALCLMPFVLEVKEGLRWKYYISKI